MATIELEDVFSKIRELAPAEKAHIAVTLADMVEQAKQGRGFDKAMDESPEFRAYVEAALDEAEADRVDGRVRPAEEVFDELLGNHRAKHGL